MPRIAVLVELGPDQAAAIAAVRRITGQSLAEIVERVAAQKPVVECLTDMNDHEEVSAQLRLLAEELPASGATVRLFELAPEEPFTTVEEKKQFEITKHELLASFALFQEILRRQRLMDDTKR